MKKTDLEFLQEMRALTQSLINDKYDITKVEHLDNMIEDWMDELNKKIQPKHTNPKESKTFLRKVELANLIRERVEPIKFKNYPKGNGWSAYYILDNDLIHVDFKYYLDRPEVVNTIDITYKVEGTHKPFNVQDIKDTIEFLNSQKFLQHIII